MNIKQCYLGLTLLCTPILAVSAPIDIFNTGVDGSGSLLANNAADLHYSVVLTPGGNTASAKNQATIPGAWVDNGLDYQWISTGVIDSTDDNLGPYSYETTFTLGADAVIADAFLQGRWSADNYLGNIVLNGNEVVPAPPNANAYTDLHTFSISSGFDSGINTLIFSFTNLPRNQNPTGLLVIFDETSDGQVDGVPIPAAVWLFSFGLLGLLGKTRKKHSTIT